MLASDDHNDHSNDDDDDDDKSCNVTHSLARFDLSSLEEMRNVSPTPNNSDDEDEGDGDEEAGAEERRSALSSPQLTPLPLRTSSLPPEQRSMMHIATQAQGRRRSDTQVIPVSVAFATAAMDAQRSAFKRSGRSRSMVALQNVRPHLATPLTDAEIAQLQEKAAWAREVSTGRIPARVLTLNPQSLIQERCILYAIELGSFDRHGSAAAQTQLGQFINCLCCARAAIVAYFKRLKRYAKLKAGSTSYVNRPSIAFHLSCSEGLRGRLLANHSDLALFHWTTYPDQRRGESDAEGVELTCEHVVHLTETLCSFQRHCKKRTERGGGGEGTRQLCKFFIFHSDAALCERLHKTFRRHFLSNDTFTLHNFALIRRHFSDLLQTLELCTDALTA
jgi:hypothetical protein